MAQALTLPRPIDGVRSTALRWREQARRLVNAHPRGAVGLGVLGFVSFVALGGIVVPNPATNPAVHAAAPAPATTNSAAHRPATGAQGQCGDPADWRTQPRRRAFRLHRQRDGADAGARIALPAPSITRPATRTPTASARSRRWCSTGSATRPSRTASAASSIEGSTRADRLPVHLHLRRIARPPARRRWLAPRVEGCRRCALGLGLCAGRLGDPLSRRLCRPDLGFQHGKECDRRRAPLLPLGRQLGSACCVQRCLFRAGAERRCAPHCRARRPARDPDLRPAGPTRRRRSRTFRVRRRSSSRRRCAATSALPSASISSRARHRGTSLPKIIRRSSKPRTISNTRSRLTP